MNTSSQNSEHLRTIQLYLNEVTAVNKGNFDVSIVAPVPMCFCTVDLKLDIRIKEHLTNFYPLLSFYIVHMLPPMGRVFHVSFYEHIILRAMYQKAAVSMICISQHIKRVDYLNAPHFSCAEHPPFACLVCWK